MKRLPLVQILLVVLAVAAVAVGVFFAVGRLRSDRSPILLRDVTAQTGVAFQHTDGGSGKRYIVETVSGTLALFDYNGDGLLDIYFVNGAPLQGSPSPDSPPRNALYRNDGGFRFTDVTDESGAGDAGYGLGVAVGDYDNDGDPDVYVSNFGPNVLYRNNGDGTFADVTEQAGVANGDRVGAGVCFADVDQDGDLDLYAASYVDFTYENHIEKSQYGVPVYAGSAQYDAAPDALYRNNGDGAFTDVSGPSGVGELAGRGTSVISSDYDSDGDSDLFVLNDAGGNFFFRNDGTGRFEEIGAVNGLAYNGDGVVVSGMGVDGGDYDNDGLIDFFVTSYEGEAPVLYHNLGGGLFEDATLVSGAAVGSPPYVQWGVGLVDLDNDGDRDIFLANGHLQDNVEQFDGATAYEAANIVLMNVGESGFVNISDRCGDGLAPVRSSRAAAFGDLDNDGDLDIVVVNSRRAPTVIRNDSATGNHWIEIRLEGVQSNRDGIGAQVKVVSGELTQVDEARSGRGYKSHWGTRLHFGLGPRSRIDRIEVRWAGGAADVLKDVAANQILAIREGDSPAPNAPPADTTQE